MSPNMPRDSHNWRDHEDCSPGGHRVRLVILPDGSTGLDYNLTDCLECGGWYYTPSFEEIHDC